jgi:uncharacterized protein YjbJ (UPF0337 family)
MKLSTRCQAKGIFRVVRGTVKEMAGRISSNTTLGYRGRFERLAGRIQWKFGKAQGFCGL